MPEVRSTQNILFFRFFREKGKLVAKYLNKLGIMNQLSLTTNQVHIVDMLIRKNPKLDRGILETAVAFIADAHEGQYRKSGMPYTEHPYEVAKILADLKQDQPTVLAGLLHDVVEDTPHTLK